MSFFSTYLGSQQVAESNTQQFSPQNLTNSTHDLPLSASPIHNVGLSALSNGSPSFDRDVSEYNLSFSASPIHNVGLSALSDDSPFFNRDVSEYDLSFSASPTHNIGLSVLSNGSPSLDREELPGAPPFKRAKTSASDKEEATQENIDFCLGFELDEISFDPSIDFNGDIHLDQSTTPFDQRHFGNILWNAVHNNNSEEVQGLLSFLELNQYEIHEEDEFIIYEEAFFKQNNLTVTQLLLQHVQYANEDRYSFFIKTYLSSYLQPQKDRNIRFFLNYHSEKVFELINGNRLEPVIVKDILRVAAAFGFYDFLKKVVETFNSKEKIKSKVFGPSLVHFDKIGDLIDIIALFPAENWDRADAVLKATYENRFDIVRKLIPDKNIKLGGKRVTILKVSIELGFYDIMEYLIDTTEKIASNSLRKLLSLLVSGNDKDALDKFYHHLESRNLIDEELQAIYNQTTPHETSTTAKDADEELQAIYNQTTPQETSTTASAAHQFRRENLL